MIPRYNIKRIRKRLNNSGGLLAPPRLDLPPPELPFTIDELKISVYPTDNYDWLVGGEEGFAQEVLAFRNEVQKVLSKYVEELQDFSLPYSLRSDPQMTFDRTYNLYSVISVPISFTIDKLGLRGLFTVFGKIHPDFEDIRDSDDFHDWAEEQPQWVQNALYENEDDAKSAARAIDLYKSDRGMGKKDTSKSSKNAAKAVSTKNKTSVPDANNQNSVMKESDVQRMSADEYEKNSDMIMEAIRSGNFVYDVSGSAR